jgi:hypothetical protein
MGVVPALFLVYTLVNARGLPVINDISTDLVYPPALAHAATVPANEGRDMSFPAAFKDDIQDHYADLQSLGLNRMRDDVFAKALDLARRQPGWTVTASTVTANESIIEGEAATRMFGFVDDWAWSWTCDRNRARVKAISASMPRAFGIFSRSFSRRGMHFCADLVKKRML